MKKTFLYLSLLLVIILLSACGVIEYQINFNTNGGIEVESITTDNKEELTLPNTTKFGYIFGGWFTDNVSFANRINNGNKVTKNMTLYAKWNPVQYTLLFDSNNGSVLNPMQITFGENYNLPTPQKENFYFGGWFVDNETFQTQFNFENNISNKTIYAKWIDYYGSAFYNGAEIEEDGLNTFVLGVPTPADYVDELLEFSTINEEYDWVATQNPDFDVNGDALVIITIYIEIDDILGYSENDEFIGESYLELHITE